MTTKLYFSNPGEIDIRAVTTLGVNVKPEGNPIGHFGTGLKYAIAGVLRLGGSIKVYSGLSEYIFGATAAEIRGKEFGIVTMDTPGTRTPLGFTTDLGKDWEPWMLYRELRSNCVDEGGDFGVGVCLPEAGTTLIEVGCEALAEAHASRALFWLEPAFQTLLWSGHGLEVYKGTSSNLFYHGIRATAKESGKTADWSYKYSLTGEHKLTEDRTLASFYEAGATIASALLRCDNEELLEAVLTQEPEMSLDYQQYHIAPSQEFVAVVLRLIERKEKLSNSARAKVRNSHEQEVEEAELEIPSSFSDMERLAPEEAPEVKASKWAWESETSERIEALEKEVRYWKACAKKLGAQANG